MTIYEWAPSDILRSPVKVILVSLLLVSLCIEDASHLGVMIIVMMSGWVDGLSYHDHDGHDGHDDHDDHDDHDGHDGHGDVNDGDDLLQDTRICGNKTKQL